MLLTLVISIILIGIAFAGIGIKMFAKKGGQFERRCENEGSKMCVCGGKKCTQKHNHHGDKTQHLD